MQPKSLFKVLVAGTIALAGTGLAAPSALAFTPVSELKDVPPTHWAYNAIQTLVEKYEVLEGFPDNTFRGNRTLTRYEVAAALAKVMAKVEEMIASATGQPINVDKGLNPEDLRTIARLQREFRDELEVLKGRVDILDTRVGAIEKRLRWGGEMRAEYRDFLGASPIASTPFADYRLRSRLNLDATLTDTIAYHGSLLWDVYGAPSTGDAFATARSTTSSNPFTEMYIYRSYGSYTPGWMNLHGGLVNVSEVLNLGSSMKDPFATNVWREATGGFGFVGTPGLAVDAGATPNFATVGSGDAATRNVWWLPGTDVALQSLDPNATQGVFPLSSFTVAANGEAGPFSLGVGVYQPGVAGRDVARLGALGYPASLPGPETYATGSRMLAALGADFGFVRAQVAAKTPSLTDNLGAFNKTLTGSVDVGTDALGLSVQGVALTDFGGGNFVPARVSAKLASNDLFGTGFGLGLGTNMGTAVNTAGQTFVGPAGNRSLMQGLAGIDYGSYGLYLRIPGFSILPSLTLAAQQTAGPGFSGTIASGLTAQAEVQLFDLPRMQLEYSSGKFNPLTVDGDGNPTGSNGLLDQSSFISNEQLTATLVFPF
jgi:hypothetical protein